MSRSQAGQLTLRQNFSWTLTGNIVYAACGWAMLIVLAKRGSPESVGMFALGLAISAPIILFANLQLRAVQATDARQEYRFCHYLGLRLFTVALALVATILVVIAAGYRRDTALVILVITSGKAVDAISDVIYGLLQQQEQMDRIAISMILKGVLSLGALTIGQIATNSLLWAATGWSLASLVVLLAYDLRSGKQILTVAEGVASKFAPRWEFAVLWRLARLALPLGIVMMLLSLNSNIPKYFVQSHLGERELGFFAALAYVMVAGTTIVGALGQAASPRLARLHAMQDHDGFRRLLLRLIGIGGLLGAAGITVALLWGRWLLAVLYRPEYADRADILVWLMLAGAIGYLASLIGYAVTARRQFHAQLLALIVIASGTLISSYVLVPRYATLGAAQALVVSALLTAISYAFLLLVRDRRP